MWMWMWLVTAMMDGEWWWVLFREYYGWSIDRRYQRQGKHTSIQQALTSLLSISLSHQIDNRSEGRKVWHHCVYPPLPGIRYDAVNSSNPRVAILLTPSKQATVRVLDSYLTIVERNENERGLGRVYISLSSLENFVKIENSKKTEAFY